MSSTLLDLEHLQNLTYTRSKSWAVLLGGMSKKETFKEIDINTFTESSMESNDEDDELASMEDDECDKVTLDPELLRSVSNTTRFALLLNNNTLVTTDTEKNAQNEITDVFNETMPIINEHNRQLKETGFDKILSTFDKQKIEDTVGVWLSRHNSLFRENSLLCVDEGKKHKNDGLVTLNSARKTRSSKYREDDSDDSLQSGETARYIRSSRTKATKNIVSTNTLIKTCRKVNSKQEEKYDCDYQLPQYIRRRMPLDQKYHRNDNLVVLKISGKQKSHKKRKVLRKRMSSNSSSNIDSSDSDSDYNYKCKNLKKSCYHHHYCTEKKYCNYGKFTSTTRKTVKTQRCAIKMSSALRNRMYYCSHSKNTNSSTSSSSSASINTVFKSRRKTQKPNSKFYNDNRECRRESECNCSNDRRLCEKYKHVANSSTEWYVENCSSPDKQRQSPISSTMSYKSKRHANEKLSAVADVAGEDSKTKINAKENILLKEQKKMQSNNEKTSKGESNISETKKSFKNKTSEENKSDVELQMAIKASKLFYLEEQQKLTKKQKEETIRKRPTTRNNNTSNKKEEEDVLEKLPKILAVDIFTPELSTTKSITNDVSDFDIPQTIYNSTALSTKNQARNRQISDNLINQNNDEKQTLRKSLRKKTLIRKKLISSSSSILEDSKSQKVRRSGRVTSTTIRSPDINSSLLLMDNTTIAPEVNNIVDCENNSDCALVTSTTTVELVPPKRIKKEQNSNFNQQIIPHNGILVYNPKQQQSTNTSEDDYFTITKELLSKTLGEQKAAKFCKYYVGNKTFRKSSTIYYRPPERLMNGTIVISSSDSDDDLDNMGQYGDLYECLA